MEESSAAIEEAVNETSVENNVVRINAASAWEIATKHRIGKLPGAEHAVTNFGDLIAPDGFAHPTITYQHAVTAGICEAEHRDPFDRMLAAQAIIEDATLVTDDAAIKQFRAKTIC